MNAHDSLRRKLSDYLKNPQGDAFFCEIQNLAIRCEFSEIDGMACAVGCVSVLRETPSKLPMTEIQEISQALAKRLSYLVEPISVIEVDQALANVQLRSNPPQQQEQVRHYFEVNANQNGMELCRFEKKPGCSRTRVPAVFTHEVLLRLTADLFSVALEL